MKQRSREAQHLVVKFRFSRGVGATVHDLVSMDTIGQACFLADGRRRIEVFAPLPFWRDVVDGCLELILIRWPDGYEPAVRIESFTRHSTLSALLDLIAHADEIEAMLT